MLKNTNKKQKQKKELIIQALLKRLTDFGLKTTDYELFEFTEELREYICNFEIKDD